MQLCYTVIINTIHNIYKMINKLFFNQKITAVSGSRMANKKNALKGKMPVYKFIGNILLTASYNFLFNTNFTDCHTGYWAYNLKKISKNVFLNSDDNFCFDLDVRLQLTKRKFFIEEIPISTFYGTERSSMHFIYALRFFYKIFKFRLLSLI